jgi:X-X-X-Leu-X-X-Gly heptad repeat protein
MNAWHALAGLRTPRGAVVTAAAAAVAFAPSLAFAADSGGQTITAALGADGSVSSVQLVHADGSSSSYNGQLPMTMKVTHTASGSAQTYAYHVENTDSKTETLHYDDTAGHPQHTTVTVQLPLVAQLSVDVPKSMGTITATGATMTASPDGTRRLSWTMILFGPVGAAAQDVTFSTTGTGTPSAELRAGVVDPNSTAGVSLAGQNATAAYQQEDFWTGYASGAQNGLNQIAAGLSQLHDGIATGADGANQLAAGSAKAHTGSVQLASGLGKIHGGLQQLADKKKGLPTAVGGIDQMIAGVGSASNGTSLIGGLTCVKDVLTHILNGTLIAPDGDGSVGKKDQCFYSKTLNPGAAIPPLAKTTGINAIVLGAMVKDAAGAPSALTQLLGGLSNTNPSTPGLAQGLQQLRAGIAKAVDGINQLAAGSGTAYTGSLSLSSGLGKIADGQAQVAAGLPAAVSGTAQLLAGVKQANAAAVTPLTTQLMQASQNNHKELAVLDAASQLSSSAPGGAGTSYVFSQSPTGAALAASSTRASMSSSHTGRNVGIGLGGAALLLVGLGGGFAVGRRRSKVTSVV